jgi:hypothetical protein
MLIGCYRLLWVLERSSARAHHVFLLMPVGFCTERMERGCACDDDHCLTSVIVHVQRFKHTLGCIYTFEAVYNACKVRGSDVQYIELSRKLVKAEADRADIKLMSNSPSGSGRNKLAADARVRPRRGVHMNALWHGRHYSVVLVVLVVQATTFLALTPLSPPSLIPSQSTLPLWLPLRLTIYHERSTYHLSPITYHLRTTQLGHTRLPNKSSPRVTT